MMLASISDEMSVSMEVKIITHTLRCSLDFVAVGCSMITSGLNYILDVL
jgi:hypothetical protein